MYHEQPATEPKTNAEAPAPSVPEEMQSETPAAPRGDAPAADATAQPDTQNSNAMVAERAAGGQRRWSGDLGRQQRGSG